MSADHIEFRGTYRYANLEALERALAMAREQLEDDEDAAWTRAFVQRGTTLSIVALLPVAADRFLAAAVLDVLAREAIDGVVEARRGGRPIDWFPSGTDEHC